MNNMTIICITQVEDSQRPQITIISKQICMDLRLPGFMANSTSLRTSRLPSILSPVYFNEEIGKETKGNSESVFVSMKFFLPIHTLTRRCLL